MASPVKKGRQLPTLQNAPELSNDASSSLPSKPRKKRRNLSNNANKENTNNSNGKSTQLVGETDKPPRRKKKRIPQRDHVAEDAEGTAGYSNSNLSLGSAQSGRSTGNLSQSSKTNADGTPAKPRKKKARRKVSGNLASGKIESLGVDLVDIQDDIIDEGTDADSDSMAPPPYKSHMTSQPIGKLFVEQTRGFRSMHDTQLLTKTFGHQPAPVDKLTQHLHFLCSGGFKSAEKKVVEEMYAEESRHKDVEDEEAAYPAKISSMAFALTSIQVTKTFAHFCMGILAGLAIWQTLYSFALSNMSDTLPFLNMYQTLSVPINSTFYIIIVFCTVAAFDRYDVSKVTRPCLLKACTLQSGAVSALLYTVALCINVSMAPLDDRLGPKVNVTVDALRDFPTKEDETRHLTMWRILSLVRTIAVGLAWFIISLRPATDRLSKNLGQSEVTWGDNDERES